VTGDAAAATLAAVMAPAAEAAPNVLPPAQPMIGISSASYCHAAGGLSPQQHIAHDWGEGLTPHFMTAYINHALNGTSAGAAPAGVLHTAEVANDNLAQKCHVVRRDMRSVAYIEDVSSGRADSSASDFSVDCDLLRWSRNEPI